MLHVMGARCVVRDLHTIAPGPLERVCWRQFAALWGDCKKSRTAPLNAITIIIIIKSSWTLTQNMLILVLHYSNISDNHASVIPTDNKELRRQTTLASIFGSSKNPSGNTSAMVAGLLLALLVLSTFSASALEGASKKSVTSTKYN